MLDRSGTHFDKYQLLRLLGRGGNGEVYLAEYNRTYYAVKILHSQLSDDGLQEFLNEARNYLEDHPNIIRLKDFGVSKGFPFLVMDYMQQGTLRQRHSSINLPTSTEILEYLRQIANALQYVHNKGIVHRDVKPENLLIGPKGQIILSDFGIATTSYTVNPSVHQDFAGSMTYVAPEQIGQKAVRASDQYSLGIILYEWLTGTPPFKGTNMEVMKHHLKTLPPSLRGKNPHVPAAVEEVVMRALAKNPKQRFRSVIDFVDAFEQASVPIPKASSIGNSVPVPPAPIVGSRAIGGEPSLVMPPFVKNPLPEEVHQNEYRLVFDRHTEAVRSIAWSHDEEMIASAGVDENVYVWRAFSGNVSFVFHAHQGDVWGVAWSPDGKYIASAGDDAVVQIWNAQTKEAVLTYRVHSGPIYGLSWSPDGNYIASASDDESIQVWDVVNEQLKRTYVEHQSPVIAVAWSPSSDLIVSGDKSGAVQVWEISSGHCQWSAFEHEKRITSLAWSADGKYIASGSYDTTVKLWEAATGRPLFTYKNHTKAVTSVCWSPDGKYIASGSWDGTMQVWEVSTGRRLHTCYTDDAWVNAVSWSPEGGFIAFGSWDHTVRVWQVV